MRLSFRTRLTLRWVLAFGVVLALAHAAVYAAVTAFLVRDLDAQLRTLAATELASAADEPGQGLHLHEFPIESGGTQLYADKFVQLIGADGAVLMQSPALAGMPSLVDRGVRMSALDHGAPVFDVSVKGRRGRMIALTTDGTPRYLVAVGVFTDKLIATLAQLRLLLVGVWFGALVVTAVIGFSLASSALVPIRRITEKAAAIAHGEFETRLDEPAVLDEIGRMTRLLNDMLDRLRGAIDANRRFAADASHELRSPLTAMLGEIDVALKRDRTPAEYRESFEVLRERLRRMQSLTEDLMMLVRAQERQAATVAEVRVGALLQRVLDATADLAKAAGVAVTIDAAPELVIYGDPALFERAFENLVRNGIQYNREGGSVHLRARITPGAGPWTPDQVTIAVQDSGTGIPIDARERVFERFYRLDPSRSRRTGGAGLGLAITREIVQLFKGVIRVAASNAEGTEIEVQLPGGALA